MIFQKTTKNRVKDISEGGVLNRYQNFVLWSESGYFDVSSDVKPLLHLWSLGIEEQFYIFFPLLLWGLLRTRINIIAVLLGILLASFFANVYMVNISTTAAYYSPLLRIWELMIGSVLAYFLHKQGGIISKTKTDIIKNNLKAFAGLLLLLYSIAFLNKSMLFPGYWGLMPTIGAFLIISAGEETWLNKKIFSNRVLVYIGLISYPLYLWHWPILSFATILGGGHLVWYIRIALVVLSFFLAYVIYIYIEKPIRTNSSNAFIPVKLLLGMAIIGLYGFISYTHNGFGSRLATYFNGMGGASSFFRYFDIKRPDPIEIGKLTSIGVSNRCHEVDYTDPSFEYCYKKIDSKQKAILLIGDSHADHLYHGLRDTLPFYIEILQVTKAGCGAKLIGAVPEVCSKFQTKILETIKNEQPEIVVISLRLHSLESGNYLENIALELKSLGVKKVLFVGPTPEWDTPLIKLIFRKYWNFKPDRISTNLSSEPFAVNDALRAIFKPDDDFILYADTIRLFCDKDGCLSRIGEDQIAGITYNADEHHISPIASSYLSENLLAPIILKALGEHQSIRGEVFPVTTVDNKGETLPLHIEIPLNQLTRWEYGSQQKPDNIIIHTDENIKKAPITSIVNLLADEVVLAMPYLGKDALGTDQVYGFAQQLWEGQRFTFSSLVTADRRNCVSLGFYRGNTSNEVRGKWNQEANKEKWLYVAATMDRPYSKNGNIRIHLAANCKATFQYTIVAPIKEP